jgi:hypothetical protein
MGVQTGGEEDCVSARPKLGDFGYGNRTNPGAGGIGVLPHEAKSAILRLPATSPTGLPCAHVAAGSVLDLGRGGNLS